MAVSVVVRCVGREKLFRGVLDRLTHQTIAPSEIVLVMDSSSKTEVKYVRKHLEDYPRTKLVTFKHEYFSHPYSVNVGMAFSEEELVCITNGHSFPTSLRWLETGLKHFDDSEVAAVSGFFFPSNKGLSKALFYLVEEQMKGSARFTTMNCIIRRSCWKEYPFDERILDTIPETRKYGGEDYDWTLEMVSRGYKVIMDPEFSIVHIHERDIVSEMVRNVKNYFIYRNLHGKIRRLERPRNAAKFLEGACTAKRIL
jgi:GT2 family glycosyltransferase